MGIDADRMQSFTFGLGSALAAAAGALLGAMFNVYPTMGQLPLLKGFALVVMGGMGSVVGVFVSGLILGVAEGLTAVEDGLFYHRSQQVAGQQPLIT